MISSLAQTLLTHLRHRQLIPTGSKCLIALSGGGDSVALTYLLKEIAPALELELFAVHLNHGLRREGKKDSLFVKELCAHLDIPVYIAKLDVAQYAKKRGQSVEEAGRHCRYRLFRQAQAKFGANLLLTGHTADDQAETLLMRIVAGTSLSGLSGVRTKRGWIVRPLLNITRQQLRQYLQERQLTWREDSTNNVPTAPRTQTRLLLIPLLRGWNGKLHQALGRLAESAQREEKFWHHATQKLARQALVAAEPGQLQLSVSTLKKAPEALRFRVWASFLQRLQASPETVHLRALEQLLLGPANKRVCLPNHLQAYYYHNTITLGPLVTTGQPAEYATQYFDLEPGQVSLPQWSLLLSITPAEISQRPTPYCIWLNPAALSSPLCIRTKQPGDRFRPAGGQGSTKLKKYFNKLAIGPEQRNRLPLLCCGDEIVWVIGARANQSFLARPSQPHVFCFSVTSLISDNQPGPLPRPLEPSQAPRSEGPTGPMIEGPTP